MGKEKRGSLDDLSSKGDNPEEEEVIDGDTPTDDGVTDVETSTEEAPEAEEAEETREELEARLEKAEEDRDNYKEAVLISKKKDREIAPVKELSEDDAKELGDDGVNAIKTKRSNETSAIQGFLDDNPDYADDEAWAELLKHYQSPDDSSAGNVQKALANAHVLRSHANGTLVSDAEAKARETKARTDAQVNKITGSSAKHGTGSSTKTADNSGAIEMSKRFKHSDAESVGKLSDDDTTASVDVTEM